MSTPSESSVAPLISSSESKTKSHRPWFACNRPNCVKAGVGCRFVHRQDVKDDAAWAVVLARKKEVAPQKAPEVVAPSGPSVSELRLALVTALISKVRPEQLAQVAVALAPFLV